MNKKSMSVVFEKKVQFYFDEVFTYGVSNGRYGGYSIPLRLFEDVVKKIQKVAAENDATHKMYGDGSTLYLRCDQLTEKQTIELLNQGKMIIEIEFLISGTRETNTGKKLSFSVMKLQKVKKALNPPPTD